MKKLSSESPQWVGGSNGTREQLSPTGADASIQREQRQEGGCAGPLALNEGKAGLAGPLPGGPHMKYTSGRERSQWGTGCPRPSQGQGEQLRARLGCTILPTPIEGLLPRVPVLRLCATTSPQSMAEAGEGPCGPGRIHA